MCKCIHKYAIILVSIGLLIISGLFWGRNTGCIEKFVFKKDHREHMYMKVCLQEGTHVCVHKCLFSEFFIQERTLLPECMYVYVLYHSGSFLRVDSSFNCNTLAKISVDSWFLMRVHVCLMQCCAVKKFVCVCIMHKDAHSCGLSVCRSYCARARALCARTHARNWQKEAWQQR